MINLILEYVNGIAIREHNKVYIEFHSKDYKKLVCAANALNCSVAELVRIMCSPCQSCGNDKITVPLNLMPKHVSKQGPTINHKAMKNERRT